jgi:alpha-tubulin suppressor-like RCC1 family protein
VWAAGSNADGQLGLGASFGIKNSEFRLVKALQGISLLMPPTYHFQLVWVQQRLRWLEHLKVFVTAAVVLRDGVPAALKLIQSLQNDAHFVECMHVAKQSSYLLFFGRHLLQTNAGEQQAAVCLYVCACPHSLVLLVLLVCVAGAGTRIKAVAAGNQHSLALSEDGRVYSWGHGHYGALGLGPSETRQQQLAAQCWSCIAL